MPRPDSQRSEELLSRFSAGDDSALGTLLEREAPRIVGRMRQRLPRDVRARIGGSDILQLTAVELIKMRGRFKNQGVGAFRELVATVADHALCNAVNRELAQKRTPRKEREPAASPTDDSAVQPLAAIDTHTPSRECASAESIERLHAHLAELSEIDRQILTLVDLENLSFREAGERLGISVSTAQKRHSRALGHLRVLMKPGRSSFRR